MADNEDYKARVRGAMEKYYKKNDQTRVPRHNQSPERDLQKEVINWLNSLGFSVDNVESKAQFSETMQRYISQPNAPGLPDIIGNDPNGHSVYIEMKAPGKRSTLREKQRIFLNKKIDSNAFAIVVDSKEDIWKWYGHWSFLSRADRVTYLRGLLPPEKVDKDAGKPLFEDER